MISIANLEEVFSIIILVFVYLCSITVTGYAKAWTAEFFGDDTPRQLGFLSFNPFVYFDPVGFFWLFYSRVFGWGKEIPINFLSLTPGYRWLKVAVIYFSEVVISFIIAFLSLIFFMKAFTLPYGYLQHGNFLYYLVPLHAFAEIFYTYSSVMLVFGMFLVRLIIFNAIYTSMKFLINTARIGFLYALDYDTFKSTNAILIEAFVLFLMLFFFGSKSINLLLRSIEYMALLCVSP